MSKYELLSQQTTDYLTVGSNASQNEKKRNKTCGVVDLRSSDKLQQVYKFCATENSLKTNQVPIWKSYYGSIIEGRSFARSRTTINKGTEYSSFY